MKFKGIKGSKNLKIIAATSMAIFSLLTTFTAAFAWFTSLHELNNEYEDFDVYSLDGAFNHVTFHNSLGSHEYYLVGTMSGSTWDSYNDVYGVDKTMQTIDGKTIYASDIVSLKRNNELKVRALGSTGDEGYYGGSSNATINSDGKYMVYFCPEGGISDWSTNGGYFNIVSVAESEYRYNYNGKKRLLSETNPDNTNERVLIGFSMVKGETISFSNNVKTFGYANLSTSGNAYSNFSKSGNALLCNTSGSYNFYVDVTAAGDATAIRVTTSDVVNYENNYYFEETPKDTLTYDWRTNTATFENGNDISLGVYSILDKHHPMLCIFHFNETEKPVAIDVTTTNAFLATQSDIEATGNPLSSIVKYSATVGTEQDSEGHYLYSKKTLNDSFSSFAEITNGVPAFREPVDGVYSTRIWRDNVSGDRTVSVVIDYYPELIEYIYGHFIGNPLFEGDRTITFDRDWRWIIR